MRAKKKSKWLGFALGMVIYAIIVLIAASAGLKYLWDFAAEYESELPTYKMTEYISSLNETHVRKISTDFIATLDHNIQSSEDAFSVIWKAFVPGVRFRQITSSEDGQSVTYTSLKTLQERMLDMLWVQQMQTLRSITIKPLMNLLMMDSCKN